MDNYKAVELATELMFILREIKAELVETTKAMKEVAIQLKRNADK
jgi:hypothetical protein